MKSFFKKLILKFLSFLGFSIENEQSAKLKKYQDPFFLKKNILKSFNEPLVIFDVGAYIGNITNKYLEYFPNSTIYCLEPFPDSFSKLEKNFQKINRVKKFNLALSDEVGKVLFHSNQFPETNSILPTEISASEVWGSGKLKTINTCNVQMNTLDSFCKQNQVGFIHLLKLDVQGSEYNALKGAKSFLGSKKIYLIYLEIILSPTYTGQGTFLEIHSYLDSFGYKLVGIFNHSYTSKGMLRQIDALFTVDKLEK